MQPDGQLLTESKVTTEHEEINDKDLPDEEVSIDLYYILPIQCIAVKIAIEKLWLQL